MVLRTIIAAAIIVLSTAVAQAQGHGARKGTGRQPDTHKTEDLAKKKADEKPYKDALKVIPESKEKSAPLENHALATICQTRLCRALRLIVRSWQFAIPAQL